MVVSALLLVDADARLVSFIVSPTGPFSDGITSGSMVAAIIGRRFRAAMPEKLGFFITLTLDFCRLRDDQANSTRNVAEQRGDFASGFAAWLILLRGLPAYG